MSGRRRRNEFPTRAVFSGAVILVLLIALLFGREKASGAFWDHVAPLVSLRNVAGSAWSAVISPFYGKATLLAQNEELQAELAETKANAADRDALYQENIALKTQLGRSDTAINAVLAAVVARPPGVPYDTLIIDAGQNFGISKGDLVAGGEGALIGEVSDVYGGTSRVVLFSSPGTTHEGLLDGTLPVDVEGAGAGALTAQVPTGTQVVLGDMVELPSIAAGITAVVAHVEETQSGSFKTLDLSLPANVFSLRFVSVWRGRQALPDLPPTGSATTTRTVQLQ